MSGSGGGGTNDDSWRIIGGSPAGEDNCTITEQTILNSPNAAIVATLTIGQILSIVLVQVGLRSRLEAVTIPQGQTAGAITSTRMVDIIECIQDGSTYEAEVISINAGRVGVEIRLT